MSDRYQNSEACGIEPEREGDDPTLEQWRDRCRQLWKENVQLRKRYNLVEGRLGVASEALKEIAGRCHNRLATIEEII